MIGRGLSMMGVGVEVGEDGVVEDAVEGLDEVGDAVDVAVRGVESSIFWSAAGRRGESHRSVLLNGFVTCEVDPDFSGGVDLDVAAEEDALETTGVGLANAGVVGLALTDAAARLMAARAALFFAEKASEVELDDEGAGVVRS